MPRPVCDDDSAPHDHYAALDDSHASPHDGLAAQAATDPVLTGRWRPSRRSVLQAGGVAAVAAATRSLWVPGAAWASSSTSLTGQSPVRNAMHVHASWSEGPASWESQFAQAASVGTDVLWMTDHDFRGLAFDFIDSLDGVPMVATESGSLAQRAATIRGGVARVVAESSSATRSASMSFATPVKPTAFNVMRTSIAGQVLTVGFPSCRIDAGGTYDVVVQLSNHPAYGDRPAGQFELCYRFGDFQARSFVDGSGIVGFVTAPTPADGSEVELDLRHDVHTLWPDMLATDNSTYLLTLVATSPGTGVLVDVSATVQFTRAQNSPDQLIEHQQTVINTYGPRYPALTVHPSVEISYLDPHINPFGVPQFWPDQTEILQTRGTAYSTISENVHAQGGLVSYNHPFGATQGKLLPLPEQTALRRRTFGTMMADNRMGTDILEVGYTTRGSCNTQTHLDLWDTFSRNGIFITGNGVNDDHNGLHWAKITNGFATGIWAGSPSQADLVAALAGGRAYTYHVSRWPGGALDLLIGKKVKMGQVAVSSKTSRKLRIHAASLPTNSMVDVVQGPVDYTGNDPGTVVVQSIPAAQFGRSAIASLELDTSRSCFTRVQVRNEGYIIGISNPIWTLQAPPAAGVPAPRIP